MKRQSRERWTNLCRMHKNITFPILQRFRHCYNRSTLCILFNRLSIVLRVLVFHAVRVFTPVFLLRKFILISYNCGSVVRLCMCTFVYTSRFLYLHIHNIKVKGQIMYFLVNAPFPKSLAIATSIFADA